MQLSHQAFAARTFVPPFALAAGDAPPRATLLVLSEPPPAIRDGAIRSPSTRKPAWLTALDAFLDPRVDAIARWLSSR